MPDTLSSSDLLGLIDRLERATGPDRDTDQDLFDVVHLGIARREVALPHCPKYTSSLDAALSLVERKMPGRTYTLTKRKHLYMGVYPFEATIWGEDRLSNLPAQSAFSKANLPIALLIALLKALQP